MRTNMRLTPAQFAEQVPIWYQKWSTDNPGYYPLEQRLSGKAASQGCLDVADLVAITQVLGNPHNVGGRMARENTDTEVRKATGVALKCLDDPTAALNSVLRIRRWGRTYATKTLRCMCPRDYAALDSVLVRNISTRYLSARDEALRYVEFLRLLRNIREMVTAPGPRANDSWYLADIEVALFQFVWDGGTIV
jgi:hypothetical protein